MRYSKEHKAETHQRILDTAAPLFRRNGFDAVSVDKLMAAVELTRGGFYAHFESKEALIEAILTRDAGLVKMLRERIDSIDRGADPDLLNILKDYLDPKNLDEIIEGCPLATMPVDAARAAPNIKAAYGKRFSALTKQLARGFGPLLADDDDAIAIAVLAVGGIVLARASATEKEGDRIASACFHQIEKLLSRGDGSA